MQTLTRLYKHYVNLGVLPKVIDSQLHPIFILIYIEIYDEGDKNDK